MNFGRRPVVGMDSLCRQRLMGNDETKKDEPMNPPSAGSRPSGGVVVPEQVSWLGRGLARFIQVSIHALAATVRFEIDPALPQLVADRRGPLIFCLWHNRLALSLEIYRKFLGQPGSKARVAAMVSASKDGALLARVLELFEVVAVRGSSSRRGPQALLELTSWAERGFDLAITPDGPRGPVYEVQPGVIGLARATGLPILPVSCSLTRKMTLKSWDRFQVPRPFARCRVSGGPLFLVPKESTPSERQTARQALQERLRQITSD